MAAQLPEGHPSVRLERVYDGELFVVGRDVLVEGSEEGLISELEHHQSGEELGDGTDSEGCRASGWAPRWI